MRNVRWEWFCNPARYPCLPSPRRMKEAVPNEPELKFPTILNSSSWVAWREPANAFATGSPRFDIIRLLSQRTSFFFLMIFLSSFKVFVTGSTRPQRSRPFHVICGNLDSGSSSNCANSRLIRFAVASLACFVPRMRTRCFFCPGNSTLDGAAMDAPQTIRIITLV